MGELDIEPSFVHCNTEMHPLGDLGGYSLGLCGSQVNLSVFRQGRVAALSHLSECGMRHLTVWSTILPTRWG